MTAVRRREVVRVGRAVPGVAVRAAPVAAACTAFALLPLPYAVFAVALAAVGAAAPSTLGVWGAVLVIGIGQLAGGAGVPGWRPFAVLAVVHGLHVLAGLGMVVPLRARVQLRALVRPALRWVAIQVPAQLVLVVVMLGVPRAGETGSAWWAVAGAAAAVGIVVGLRLLAGRR